MAVFTWEGRTRQGTTKKGVMEAGSEAAVMAQLRSQAIVPLAVKAKAKDLLEGLKLFKAGPNTRDLVIFTRQFATMIDAGLPLVQCLSIQGEQQAKAGFKAVILAVKAEVEQGSTFADALGKHPKVFDDLYVNLVRAGEVGGILDTILNRLAQYMEKADKLKRKVKGAMVYPSAILVVSIGVITLLLVKVIPVFKKMFEEFGGALPAPTQMVAVGESTGAMDTMLAKIADFYDDEVDAAVNGLTALLEPIMMVFLGGTIGGILMAMYLPIFKIADAVK